jgi:hypothetical protein
VATEGMKYKIKRQALFDKKSSVVWTSYFEYFTKTILISSYVSQPSSFNGEGK